MAQDNAPSKPREIGDKYIRFAVAPGGEVEIKPFGFSDGTCMNATKSYEDAIGAVSSRQYTGPDCIVKQQVKAGKK